MERYELVGNNSSRNELLVEFFHKNNQVEQKLVLIHNFNITSKSFLSNIKQNQLNMNYNRSLVNEK